MLHCIGHKYKEYYHLLIHSTAVLPPLLQSVGPGQVWTPAGGDVWWVEGGQWIRPNLDLNRTNTVLIEGLEPLCVV